MNPQGSDNVDRYNREEDGVLLLESKHIISILIFLKKNGTCKKTDIYQSVARTQKMMDKLDILAESGFIFLDNSTENRTHMVSLTDFGDSIAS